MPRKRRSPAPLIFIALLAGCLCVGAGFAGMRAGLESLGPASSQLSPVEQVLLGAYLLFNRPSLVAHAPPPLRSASLDIEPGMDAGAVAAELERLGVLDRPDLLSRYLQYRGLDTAIEAGRYQVTSGMSIIELADLLQEARDSRYKVTIPEGWRREQVAEVLARLDLGFTGADFLEATHPAPPAWSAAPGSAETLEGFLFPDTYQLDPGMSADEVAELMVANLEDRLTDEVLAGFAAQGLSPFEAVVLASIVEREAVLAAERPLIASVFLNRLALGIPLQADPTVQYPLGRQPDGWWKAPLSSEDLQVDSPYNTYLHGGLPPGPIASPGSAALESVATPARTGYLFFRAACDGSGRHLFAATFEEHIANACP